MRKFIYIIICLLMITAALWFFIVKPKIRDIIYPQISKIAPSIKKGELEPFLFGLKFNSDLKIAAGSFPITLSKPAIKISPISLLSLAPMASLSAGYLGGEINSSFMSSGKIQQLESKIALKEIKLEQDFILKLIGLSSGTLNADLSITNFAAQQTLPFRSLPDGKVSIRIENLTIPVSNKLPAFISKIPVKIPTFSDGELLIKANCQNNKCFTDSLEFSSSLGLISGQSNLELQNSQPNYKLNLDFALTKSGKEQLLPVLSLFNYKLMDTPDKPFTLKLAGNSKSLNVSVLAID